VRLAIVGYPSRVSCTGGSLFAKGDDYERPDAYKMSFEHPNGKFIAYELTGHTVGRTFMDIPTGLMVYVAGGSACFTGFGDVHICDGKGKEIRFFKTGGETQLGSPSNPAEELDRLHVGKFIDRIRAHDPRTNASADEAAMPAFMPLLANHRARHARVDRPRSEDGCAQEPRRRRAPGPRIREGLGTRLVVSG